MEFESSNVIVINVATQHYPPHLHIDAMVACSSIALPIVTCIMLAFFLVSTRINRLFGT
jgi:hypothetical protein